MRNQEINYKNKFSTFDVFKQEVNRKVLIDIISISLTIEILYCVLSKIGVKADGLLRTFIDPAYLKFQILSIGIYALLLLLVLLKFGQFPRMIGFLAISFALYQKVVIFLLNTDFVSILVFWIILSLLFSLYFIDDKIIIFVHISSFLFLIYGLLHMAIPIDEFAVYLWFMMISLIISILISHKNYIKQQGVFNLRNSLYLKNEEYINYASLFNSGHITAIVWLLEEGRPIAFVTENVATLLGYSTEEMMSEEMIFEQLIHPDDIGLIRNTIAENLKKRKSSFEQKYRIRRSDDRYIWIRDYNVPVWEEDRVTHINGYLFDINAEVETEFLLEENNKRLSNVVEATNACIWEWDLNSGLINFNKKFWKMTGYESTELQPYTIQKWKELLHPDDLPLFNGAIEEYLSGYRDHYDIICRIKHKQGNWIWIHDKGKIIGIDERDKPRIMFGNLIDITQIKETEAMVHHSEKLSALGRLSGGIAHDMNNQLMKIQGTAEMAKIWDSKTHYRESLDTIETLCDSASWIIHQLMEYSGNNEYHPEICDLTTILLELSKLLDHTFEKEIHVKTQLADVKILVNADRALLKKVFFNICFNAKEAMSHGGTLKISSEILRIKKRFATYTGDLPGGDYIKIDFSDEGKGISEENFDKIFEPFFTTKEFGTQGLGLAKVASVVKEHGGGIQVWSKVGIGSVFSIFLPLAAPLIGEKDSGQSKKHIRANALKEILIIDDELMICELLSAYFSQMKWKSRYFTNPLEGIEYYRENKDDIGLVILDKFMPELNGDRVLDELVMIQKDVRTLYISGFSQDIDDNSNHRDNIAGYLKKPVKLDDLKKIIEEEFSL